MHLAYQWQQVPTFEPDNPNNVSLFAAGSADNIQLDDVVAALKQVVAS